MPIKSSEVKPRSTNCIVLFCNIKQYHKLLHAYKTTAAFCKPTMSLIVHLQTRGFNFLEETALKPITIWKLRVVMQLCFSSFIASQLLFTSAWLYLEKKCCSFVMIILMNRMFKYHNCLFVTLCCRNQKPKRKIALTFCLLNLGNFGCKNMYWTLYGEVDTQNSTCAVSPPDSPFLEASKLSKMFILWMS